jgi:hypothetical protein
VRVRQGNAFMDLHRGQVLRRCVQKGWLMKKANAGKFKLLRRWKRRYFRVVVHTTVQPVLPGGPEGHTGEPTLDEVITAAWLLYYEDATPGADAKSTIVLGGTRAQPVQDDAMSRKYPDAFEIFHPRRRTYFLRPCPPEDGSAMPQTQRTDHWIATVNAAVDTVGKLFTLRFRRAVR